MPDDTNQTDDTNSTNTNNTQNQQNRSNSTFLVGCDNIDGNEQQYIDDCVKALTSAGLKAESIGTSPDHERVRNEHNSNYTVVFIVGGCQAGCTWASFVKDGEGLSDPAFTIVAYAGWTSNECMKCAAAAKDELVAEHDCVGGSAPFYQPWMDDYFKGQTIVTFAQKYGQYIGFCCSDESATDLGNKIANGTCGTGGVGGTVTESGGSAQIKDKTFEHCIKRICAATDSIFLVENNAAVLFPYTDWMAFTLRQQINQIRAKDMDPDLFEIDYNTEGFYNKVTTVWGADETDEQPTTDQTNEEEKEKVGNTTTIQKTMPTGGTQLSEQYDPLVDIYGELEKKVTTNFPNEETAHYVMNALLIQYVRDFNNSCRVRAINNQKFIGGTFYAVENPSTKKSEMFYLNSYTIFKNKDEPITTDMEFKYGPEGAEELLDYQAYGGGAASGGQTSATGSATEEEIWKGTQKACHQWTCGELRTAESETLDPQVAEDYYNKNVKAGKKFCLTCYGMSSWLYYQFNNKAGIPCRVIGNSEHHVVELYKNNQWYKPTKEYSKYCEEGYHYNDYLRTASPVVLDAPNSPGGNNTNSNPSGNTANQNTGN